MSLKSQHSMSRSIFGCVSNPVQFFHTAILYTNNNIKYHFLHNVFNWKKNLITPNKFFKDNWKFFFVSGELPLGFCSERNVSRKNAKKFRSHFAKFRIFFVKINEANMRNKKISQKCENIFAKCINAKILWKTWVLWLQLL